MARLGWTATVVAAVSLGGCASLGDTELATSTLPKVQPASFVPGVPKGYHCPLVPNGFDPAGSIYRIDRSGTYYRVKDFKDDPVVNAGRRTDVQIANYVLSDSQKSNAGLSFALLQNALPGLSADASVDFSKEVTVDITVEDLQGEVIYDTAADHILAWFRQNVEPKPGSTYFLVRESVRAGAVSYALKAKDIAKLGGKAQLEKIAEGKANVTVRDDNGRFEIKQKFEPRIHVCIKSAEIAIEPKRADGVISASVKPVEDSRQPTIKRVGASVAEAPKP